MTPDRSPADDEARTHRRTHGEDYGPSEEQLAREEYEASGGWDL